MAVKIPIAHLCDCATGNDEKEITFGLIGKTPQNEKSAKPFMPGTDGKYPITAKPNDEPS